jgi:hypothetical protein
MAAPTVLPDPGPAEKLITVDIFSLKQEISDVAFAQIKLLSGLTQFFSHFFPEIDITYKVIGVKRKNVYILYYKYG